MRNRVRCVLTKIVGLGVLCGAGWLQAQDQAWLKNNDRGTRFEGLVDRPNAKRDYEVLGLFGYKNVPSQPAPGDHLQLMYYVPKDDRVASITVKELESETQYLMKPKPDKVPAVAATWNTYNDWPVSTVILPNHVALGNLGVLVRLEDRVDGMLSPALLFTTKQPQAVSQYSLDFVSHRSLRNVSCVVIPETGGSQPCAALPKGTALEESIPMEFVISAAKLPPGRVTVRVGGDYANTMGEKMNAEVHFIHHDLTK